MTDLRQLEIDYDPVPTNGQIPVYDATGDIWMSGRAGGIEFLGTAGGTASAITLSGSPTVTSYSDGDTYSFKASANSIGTVTINIDGVGATVVRKQIGEALYFLTFDDLATDQIYTIRFNSSAGGHWIVSDLSNPELIFTTGTLVSVVSTTTTTTLFGPTILADTLGSQRGLEFDVWGAFDNQTAGLRAFTIECTYGTTIFATFTILLGTLTTEAWRVNGTIRGRASTVAQHAGATITVGGSTVGTPGGLLSYFIDSNAAVAETSTTDLSLLIEVTMAFADVTTVMYGGAVEYI